MKKSTKGRKKFSAKKKPTRRSHKTRSGTAKRKPIMRHSREG